MWGGVGGVFGWVLGRFWGVLGGLHVRHLEAISQDKRLWINTNEKAAKQTIGAKWTQLIPPASGHIIGFPERHADGAAGADEADGAAGGR